VFTATAVREAVAGIHDAPVATASPVDPGNNHAYRVTFRDGRRAFLKVGTRFPDAFPAEPATVAFLAQETTVPVPEVLTTGTEPLEYPFAVYEYVDGAGTINLLDAAVEAGVEAFVMESAIGVGDEPASPLAAAFDVVIQPIQRAKAEAEAAIREAPVRHTVLRPGVLTNGPRTDTVSVAEPGAKLWGSVSRADVARLMIAAPVTPAAADRTLEVVAKPSFPKRSENFDWQLPGSGASETITVETPDDGA